MNIKRKGWKQIKKSDSFFYFNFVFCSFFYFLKDHQVLWGSSFLKNKNRSRGICCCFPKLPSIPFSSWDPLLIIAADSTLRGFPEMTAGWILLFKENPRRFYLSEWKTNERYLHKFYINFHINDLFCKSKKKIELNFQLKKGITILLRKIFWMKFTLKKKRFISRWVNGNSIH